MSVALISLYDHWAAGPRSIHSVMNSKGIETDLIFFHTLNDIYAAPSADSFDSLIALLKDIKPEIVGISVRSQFWWMAKRIARRVREELGLPVVLGGVHVTLNPDEAIEVSDIICLGEGEAALPELVRRLREGIPINDIPCLWTRDKDGVVVRNEPTIAIQDLDTAPLPITDRSYLVRMTGPAVHCDPLFDDKENILYMISASRGCPFKCSFCCESVYKKIFKEPARMRRRSVEHLFEEFRLAKSRFPKLLAVAFVDEVFHPPADWMAAFVSRYKKEVGIYFSIMIHPGLISEKWIDSLLETGAPFSVNFGLQSGSARVRKEIFDRPTSDKQIDRVVNILNSYPIGKVVDIIVDNPFESPDEFRETVKSLFSLNRPLSFQPYAMMFYPGLTLTQRALDAGFARKEDLPGYAEDRIDLWVPRLEDPGGNPLKTFLKVLVHLHQLRMTSLFGPPKDYHPIPERLLRSLANKRNVTAFDAKMAVRAHGYFLRLAVATYNWRAPIQKGLTLLKSGQFGDFFKKSCRVLFTRKHA